MSGTIFRVGVHPLLSEDTDADESTGILVQNLITSFHRLHLHAVHYFMTERLRCVSL